MRPLCLWLSIYTLTLTERARLPNRILLPRSLGAQIPSILAQMLVA